MNSPWCSPKLPPCSPLVLVLSPGRLTAGRPWPAPTGPSDNTQLLHCITPWNISQLPVLVHSNNFWWMTGCFSRIDLAFKMKWNCFISDVLWAAAELVNWICMILVDDCLDNHHSCYVVYVMLTVSDDEMFKTHSGTHSCTVVWNQ